MYRVGIITVSDKGSQGLRKDESGPAIAEILSKANVEMGPIFETAKQVILPDEQTVLETEMKNFCDKDNLHLILTTGGTGFSKRDVTPEATLAVIERRADGIPEAMRAYSLTISPRAMLSRAVAGIRGNTLIINMPGSPRAVREVLPYILPQLVHGLDILNAKDAECGS